MNTKFIGKKFLIILGILFFTVSSSLFSQIDSQQGKSKIKWFDVTVFDIKQANSIKYSLYEQKIFRSHYFNVFDPDCISYNGEKYLNSSQSKPFLFFDKLI